MNYPEHIACNYTFKYNPPYKSYNTVYLHAIDIENSEACKNDSLSIYDGDIRNGVLFDRICGVQSARSYMVSGDTIFMQFKTNGNISRRGFQTVFQQDIAGGLHFQEIMILLQVCNNNRRLTPLN